MAKNPRSLEQRNCDDRDGKDMETTPSDDRARSAKASLDSLKLGKRCHRRGKIYDVKCGTPGNQKQTGLV